MYATCDGTHAVTFVCMCQIVSCSELFTDQYVVYYTCEMSLVLGSLYNKLFRWGMCKVVNGLANFSTCIHMDKYILGVLAPLDN